MFHIYSLLIFLFLKLFEFILGLCRGTFNRLCNKFLHGNEGISYSLVIGEPEQIKTYACIKWRLTIHSNQPMKKEFFALGEVLVF